MLDRPLVIKDAGCLRHEHQNGGDGLKPSDGKEQDTKRLGCRLEFCLILSFGYELKRNKPSIEVVRVRYKHEEVRLETAKAS